MSTESHFDNLLTLCFNACNECKVLEKKAVTLIDVSNEFKSYYDYRILVTQTDNPIQVCVELLNKFPQLLGDPIFGYFNLLSMCIKIKLYKDALGVNNIIYGKLLCYIGKEKFDENYTESAKYWKRVLDINTFTLFDLAMLIRNNTKISKQKSAILSFKQLDACIKSLMIISDQSNGELGEVNVFIEVCKAVLCG